MNDFRCETKFCTRCALSFGLGYQDVAPGTPIDNPLPLAMGAHDVGETVMASDMPEFNMELQEYDVPPGVVPGLGVLSKSPTSLTVGLPADYDERKRLQIWTFLTQYFPDAFLAVVDVAVKGNDQHNAGEPLHWARGKSMDQMNTAARHMFDHSTVGARDTDGCYHLAKAIWRLSAELQLLIESEHNKGEK